MSELLTQSSPLPHLSIEELLRDDAPLVALLSLRENPLLHQASDAQLQAIVMKCRMVAATPSKIKSLVSSGNPKTKRSAVPSAQRLAQMKKFSDED